jgi:DNA polymerase III delta subunit
LEVLATDLKPVYLLTGSDRPKVDLALTRLRARFDDAAVETLSAIEASGADAAAACNVLGLFGSGQRLVVVDEVDGRPNAEGRLGGGWKADDVDALRTYLESPAPDTVLALVGRELKKESPLAKLAGKHGDVLTYEITKRQLPEWIAAQFSARSTPVDNAACRLLVELVGEDPYRLAGEIDKIASWAGGEQVTEHVVELLSAGGAETPGYALTDAWGRRDVAGVLEATESMLERSGDPRAGVPLRVVGLLSGHVGLVRACQRLAAEGIAPKDAALRLKRRSVYPVEKAYNQARNFSEDELRAAIVRLADLDQALKGGSRLAGDLQLERTLVEVTRKREPVDSRS